MANKVLEDAYRVLSQLIEESIRDREVIVAVIPITVLHYPELSKRYFVRFEETINLLIKEGIFEIIERYDPEGYPFHAGKFRVRLNLKKSRKVFQKLKPTTFWCGDLFFDREAGNIGYKNKIMAIDPETKSVKFLYLLMNNIGKLLSHAVIAEKFKLEYIEGEKNTITKKAINDMRRDLAELLENLGMSKKIINSMIKGNGGYKLNCPE